jgi:hypothetical protein
MKVQLVTIWVMIFIVFTAQACKDNTTDHTNSFMFNIQSGGIEWEVRIYV